jgi:hypothetical protein
LYVGEGKFLSHDPANTRDRTTDVLTVAHHGLFYLESGRSEWSQEAAQFLCQAYDNQTDLTNRFSLRFNMHNQPIVEHAAEQQMFFSLVKHQGENQLYFMMAYPCAFLGLHYRKTGNTASLDYAKRYMDFMLSCGEGIYSSRFSHKTAWAASILYAETREEKYFAVVQRIVDFFVSIQSPDGLWFQEEGANVYLDQSAEIGCWFSQIIKNVHLAQVKKNDFLRFLGAQPHGSSAAVCHHVEDNANRTSKEVRVTSKL